MALVNHYLKVTAEHIKEYGEDTVVLYQVGDFFEVYAIKDRITLKINGSKLEDFCRICDCAMYEKKNSKNGKPNTNKTSITICKLFYI